MLIGRAAQGERLGVSAIWMVEINGHPGAMFVGAEGRAVSVILLHIAGGLVQTVRGISNPEKLRHLDLRAGEPWQIDH